MKPTFADKETPAQYSIHPLIRDRWSSRSFADKKVSLDTINSLLEAIRWAPSSMNEQPWQVMVAEKGTKTHQLLADTLSPGNQQWAPAAPVFLLIIARTTFGNGTPNHSALYDVGLAIGNLGIEATHRGLTMHQMGGFDRGAVKTQLGLEPNQQPVVIVAIGYRDHHEKLPDTLRQRELAPRSRKAITDFSTIEMAGQVPD